MNQQKGNNEVMPLAFNGITLNPVMRDGQIWMTASDLAKALDYSRVDNISKIYNRNADEFTEAMTLNVNMGVKGFGNGNSEKSVRIFSLRGCHLIAMMARIKVAKDFRVWVLDVLNSEVGAPVPTPTPMSVSNADWTRYLQALTIPEMVQLTGHDQTSVISGLYQAGGQLPQRRSMLSALKHSLIPQFKDSNHAINSTITGNTKKCWVFLMPNDQQESQLEK